MSEEEFAIDAIESSLIEWGKLTEEEGKTQYTCKKCREEICYECLRCNCGQPTAWEQELKSIHERKMALSEAAPRISTYTFRCSCGAGYEEVPCLFCGMCLKVPDEPRVTLKLPWELSRHHLQQITSRDLSVTVTIPSHKAPR